MSGPAAANQQSTTEALAEVVSSLRDGDRFLLTTHEGPDGDALGSLLGLHEILTQSADLASLPAKRRSIFPSPTALPISPLLAG